MDHKNSNSDTDRLSISDTRQCRHQLLGQLVLSLTGSGVSAVSFVDSSGVALAVPLPDGRVLDAPARAGDYGPLIYRP